jgi:hypothetical protein
MLVVKKYKMLFFLVLNVFKSILAEKSLDGNFLECSVAEKIDLKQDCENLEFDFEVTECQVTLNSLLEFSLANENQFKFFNVQNRGKIVVYAADGFVFDTNCHTVNKVFLHKISLDCREDLPVSFKNKYGNFQSGFVSKFGFLKNVSTEIRCDSTFDNHFLFGNIEVIRRGKLITTRNAASDETKMIPIFKSDPNVWFYNKIKEFEANPIYELTRDILGTFVGIAFIMFATYTKV